MKTFLEGFLIVVVTLGFVALVLGLPLMLLWNWLMPNIFYFEEITFWQAVGLNLLASILFNKTNIKND